MNFIYFTSGSSLFDGETRRQSLRIAEVLTTLQSAQKSHPEWDLMSSVILEEEFRGLPDNRQQELRRLIQLGLFERFRRAQIPYNEIFRREDFASAAAVAKHFAWLLRSGGSITVYVIGPGVDEIPMILKNSRAEFIDVIERDPTLEWFWPSLSKASNA